MEVLKDGVKLFEQFLQIKWVLLFSFFVFLFYRQLDT